MPARAKPAADALDLTPTPDARGDLRQLPSVARLQHLTALYSVATDGRSGPGCRVTAGAAGRLLHLIYHIPGSDTGSIQYQKIIEPLSQKKSL